MGSEAVPSFDPADLPLSEGERLVATCQAEGTITGLFYQDISGTGYVTERRFGEPGDTMPAPDTLVTYNVYDGDDSIAINGTPDQESLRAVQVQIDGPTLDDALDMATLAESIEPAGEDGIVPDETQEILDGILAKHPSTHIFFDAFTAATIDGDWTTYSGATATGTLGEQPGDTSTSDATIDADLTFSDCTPTD